ncbi:hypothetical protein BAE44_0015315 [Dichanthelium oligosanthes]|uniref:GDSL esterase/lipase n=1 Tax=Dichanthelium oligosanthes TaxID=888268 RepID=A0A1E5VEU3_9POAL|nr:hypothetical protein BAE44_0015315 [Dichanthelium oligosanthes]
MMYQMYVFGDSFADTGNLPKSELSLASRQWYKPYGTPSPSVDASQTTFVQSDSIGTWLELREGPQTFRFRKNYISGFGMNFAVAGSGVLEVPQKVPTLTKQVDQFKELIKNGTIPKWRLRSPRGKGFRRLQDLGVERILVNNMHPLGRTPLRTRASNYKCCDDSANVVASTHNQLLAEKMGNYRGNVMLLDLNTAFSMMISSSPAPVHAVKNDNDRVKLFKNKLRPSCESFDPKGYCGQEDENGRPRYSITDLGEDRFANFYWDDVHPTDGGWSMALMLLKDDIKDFLDLLST